MPAAPVKPPSNSGSPSIVRPFTTSDAPTGSTRLSGNVLERRREADLPDLAGEPLRGQFDPPPSRCDEIPGPRRRE